MRPPADLLQTLFEGAPRFIQRLAAQEIDSWEELLDLAEDISRSMPEDEQIELVNSHPRIGANPSTVSADSYREQGYDRDPGTAELQARLDRLNEEYERRFGFRFVVFVAGRPRSVIADVLEAHLDADRTAELERGLSDVVAIARDRLRKLQTAPVASGEEAR